MKKPNAKPQPLAALEKSQLARVVGGNAQSQDPNHGGPPSPGPGG
jgi:hypothetical protein